LLGFPDGAQRGINNYFRADLQTCTAWTKERKVPASEKALKKGWWVIRGLSVSDERNMIRRL
jgi:hypothetical protein